MNYFVFEFQTNETGTCLVGSFTDRVQAESAYYTILAAAAVSTVKKHGAMLCNEDMFVLKKEMAYRAPEPEPQPEPEE